MGFFGIGGGPSLDTGPAQGYINTLSNIGTQLGSQYDAAAGDYTNSNSQWRDALRNYSNYLSQDPATNQYNTTQVANAERGASEGARRAQANTNVQLAQRGISPNSAAGIGATVDINSRLAANNANIQNEVGQENINRAAQNKASLANLWGDASGTQFGRMNTIGGERNSLYQNLFDDQNKLSDERYQVDAANQLEQDKLWAGIGNTAAKAFGVSGNPFSPPRG